MNIVSKKLHALEKNVLPELPQEGTTKITWENGDADLDRAENELHRRANQILQAHADKMTEALEGGETAYNPLSPSDQAIVEAANRRFMARILEIFQAFTDAFVTYKDPVVNWVFYTRFYWLIEETSKFKEQYDAEEAVLNQPGYWELCEGEQQRRLAPVYANWNHDLFTPESFQRYCERHRIFKTAEEIEQLIANRTPEQDRADELEEQQEQAANAETDARNARYLKEKCPGCTEKCKGYFEKVGENKD
ncbi:MAG: hypothetical protein NWE95_00905 [Candidatus Bathyarchaeota archaeon]|nr:hypothetical protein [Candidatus Bathyarchaeota archaeon]